MEGNPLSTLRDVQVPPAPDGFSVLPVIVGLAALVCLLILLALLTAQLRSRWSREVADALDAAGAGPDPLTDAARILRRTGILRLGQGVARQQGEAWLASLDRIFRTRFFTTGEGRIFAAGLYAPQADTAATVAKLKRIARRRAWIPW